MTQRTEHRWLYLTSALLALAVGCNSHPQEEEDSTGSAQLLGTLEQAISSADVTSVLVTVSAADMQTRTAALVRSNNQWSGTLGKLPAGTGRTFTAEALSSSGARLYAGAATGVTILARQMTVVSITLQEVNPPAPFTNAAPIITSLAAAPGNVEPGGVVTLNASASDANASDTLTYAWSAPSGSFAQPGSLSTTWTAPAAATLVPLTLTVTDSQGLQARVTFNVNVNSGKGDALVNASLNTWPQVGNISASATALELNESTTVSATASDNDGDTLAYSWTATCAGTWTNANSATAQFTATALPGSSVCNNCDLIVTVTDSRNGQAVGGQTTGTLSICVGPRRAAVFPPDITETFQSAASTSANGTVTFRVKAADLQGSAMSFSWAANTGTPGTPTSGSDASEVVWTAPACLSSATAPTITATVSNALGASASHSFTVTGLPMCNTATSCKALLESNPSTPSGVYTVDPDGDGTGAPFSVFCDMTTAGGGWTVVEKSPYGNPIGRALFSDVSVDENSPGATRHRLSRAHMEALRAISTSMRIDCRGSDYLLTAATNLFAGQGGPNSCANAAAILYTEASLKGRSLRNRSMCTWFMGNSEGCVAWTVDEWAQSNECRLPNHPWTGTGITAPSADIFGVDPLASDTWGGHDCHTTGAVRHVLLR